MLANRAAPDNTGNLRKPRRIVRECVPRGVAALLHGIQPDRLQELLRQARAGSAEALGALLQVFRPYLLAIANQELDSELQAKGGASDLVQETFLEVQRGIGDFRGSSERELLAWLRQILLHNLANFSRQYQVVAKRQIAHELSLDQSSHRDLRDALAADGSAPGDRVVLGEQLHRLEQAVSQLPSPYREVVLWRNLERLSFDQIGQRLGRTDKAAQKLWARAIRALKKLLDQTP